MNYTGFVKSILKETSIIAKQDFGKVTGTLKTEDNNQVLTKTDLEISKHLIKRIEEVYQKHNIIDEEIGIVDRGSEYTWVLDPIDGTSNFAGGVPTFGIIIGLLRKGNPIVGGAALPFFNELIIAEKGKGAYCNEEKLWVTKENKLLSALIAYAIAGHQESPTITHKECKMLANIVLGTRNLRSSGSIFDGIMVAKGKYGGYLCRTSRIWDTVGQQVIIEEAGGVYTDFFGKPMEYSNPLSKANENFTWCIGAPKIHKQLQEIIHRFK